MAIILSLYIKVSLVFYNYYVEVVPLKNVLTFYLRTYNLIFTNQVWISRQIPNLIQECLRNLDLKCPIATILDLPHFIHSCNFNYMYNNQYTIHVVQRLMSFIQIAYYQYPCVIFRNLSIFVRCKKKKPLDLLLQYNKTQQYFFYLFHFLYY